jgi:Sec-independent protein translocase protein TatA
MRALEKEAKKEVKQVKQEMEEEKNSTSFEDQLL